MGGRWTSQNKILPGAYINFVSVPRPVITIGDRGIATIGLPLEWGAQDELIDIFSTEMLTGESLPKVGLTAFDAEAKLLLAVLSGCYWCKVYRMDKGGTKASAVINDLEVEALFEGKFGNRIIVEVVKADDLFLINTYVDGTSVDQQRVAEISELEPNKYVRFDGTGVLTAHAGVPLTNGTNGTVDEATAYPAYMNLLKYARWQTWAVTTDAATIKNNAAMFVETMRDGEGKYVQCVIGDYNAFDHEGIISNYNSILINEVPFTISEATSIIAGLTAGCPINESNTGRVIRNATGIIGTMTNSELIEATKQGFITFRANQDGSIVITQDINTLKTFTPQKNREYSKNRPIRVLDEIGATITSIWESSYMGKVTNNERGRALFRADVINYCNELQRLETIQNFAGAEDVKVICGVELEDVETNLYITPTDSMERLYMTCHTRV